MQYLRRTPLNSNVMPSRRITLLAEFCWQSTKIDVSFILDIVVKIISCGFYSNDELFLFLSLFYYKVMLFCSLLSLLDLVTELRASTFIFLQ